VSDSLIFLSYLAISATLAYLVYRTRREIPFSWMFLAFGSFIIACGFTHLMEVIVLWQPLYWLAGDIKLLTAVASVVTAAMLPPLVPAIHKLVQAAGMTEQHKRQLELANADLASANEKLKAIDVIKSNFFANVSHELRTPLTLVLGETDELLASTEDETNRSRLIAVQRNARLLLRQVNSILDAARLDAGKMQVVCERADLARFVRLTAANFGVLAAERDITFSIEGPATLTASFDAEKLQQALFNLLSNAFKFTPQGGTIVISLQADGHDARIEVRDSGPGVPPELRELIFERFRQGEGSVTRRIGGTGLGLSIAKDVVELHGGKLTVSEAPEGGARFLINLPAQVQAGNASTSSEPVIAFPDEMLEELRPVPRRAAVRDLNIDAQAMLENAPMVLLVEDNLEMSRYVAEILAPHYRVVTAMNGAEGYEQAIRLHPDLVITDIMMPVMSGDALVHAIRDHRELDSIPIMLLSARADEELRVSLLRQGAQDYMVKPFSRHELLARAGSQVALKRARDLLQKELKTRESDVANLASEIAGRNRELKLALQRTSESEALLEQKVLERTAELSSAVDRLQAEVQKRIQVEQSLRHLSARLLQLQDEERRRLARELHDSTGQVLAALQINVAALQQKSVDDSPPKKEILSEVGSLTQQAIREIRTLSYLLHPPLLDETGLVPSLRWFVQGFSDRSKIAVDLKVPETIVRLPEDIETTIFRIIQESLVNIHRHSGSQTARVEITLSMSKLTLTISDDGKGLQGASPDESQLGVGIRGMRERVRQFGGEIEFRNGSPGTIVIVTLPLAEVPTANVPTEVR
jgi:signal transduction histidine kinase